MIRALPGVERKTLAEGLLEVQDEAVLQWERVTLLRYTDARLAGSEWTELRIAYSGRDVVERDRGLDVVVLDRYLGPSRSPSGCGREVLAALDVAVQVETA